MAKRHINENNIYHIILDKRYPETRSASKCCNVYNFCRKFGVPVYSDVGLTQDQVNTLCMGIMIIQPRNLMFNQDHEMVRLFTDYAKDKNIRDDYYVSKVKETWFVEEKAGAQKVGEIPLHQATLNKIIHDSVHTVPKVTITNKSKNKKPAHRITIKTVEEKPVANSVTTEEIKSEPILSTELVEAIRTVVQEEIDKIKDVQFDSKKVKSTISDEKLEVYKRDAKRAFAQRLNNLVNAFLIDKKRNALFPGLYIDKTSFGLKFAEIAGYKYNSSVLISFVNNHCYKYPELKRFYRDNISNSDVITHNDIVDFGHLLKNMMVNEYKHLTA